MRITNQALGPRGFNARTAAGGFVQVLLQPGECWDDPELEPVAHPTLAGMIKSGDLVLGEGVVARTGLSPAEMQAELRRKAKKPVADASPA